MDKVHFNKEEQTFAKKLEVKQDRPFLTKFLDLNEQRITKIIHPKASFFGGYDNAEMKRAWINHLGNYDIICLHIKTNDTFSSFGHRDILGALLNLNIQREEIGDILLPESIVFVTEEIHETIMRSLAKIKHSPIEVSVVKDAKIDNSPRYRTMKVLLKSFRLDNVISTVYNVSRNKSKQIIGKKTVRINHRLEINPDKSVNYGDIISVKGRGRFILLSKIGDSKAGNEFVSIGIY